MANKETISEFLKNIKNWPDAIQRMALSRFDTRTGQALGVSIENAPYDTGELRKKFVLTKAKVTPTGIKSAYTFTANNKGFYYPYWVNEGKRPNGKEIKINTDRPYSKNAKKGFAQLGRDSVQNDLMNDMVRIVEEVFINS